jgi:hypothetical protein
VRNRALILERLPSINEARKAIEKKRKPSDTRSRSSPKQFESSSTLVDTPAVNGNTERAQRILPPRRIEPKRRHMPKGQRAMAVAFVYPEPEKGGRGKKGKAAETGASRTSLRTCACKFAHTSWSPLKIGGRPLGANAPAVDFSRFDPLSVFCTALLLFRRLAPNSSSNVTMILR